MAGYGHSERQMWKPSPRQHLQGRYISIEAAHPQEISQDDNIADLVRGKGLFDVRAHERYRPPAPEAMAPGRLDPAIVSQRPSTIYAFSF